MEFDTSGPWGLHPPGLFNFAAITKKCPRRSASSARAPHKRNFCAPHVDRFTLSLTNIAGLRTNGAQLKHFLHHSKPDVVCITETKLVEGVPDSLVSVPGYSIFRRDRKPNRVTLMLPVVALWCTLNLAFQLSLFSLRILS